MFNLSSDESLTLLMERVQCWNNNPQEVDLFRKMYKEALENEVFEGNSYSINDIVDNDCVNECSIIRVGDDFFEKIHELYKKGERDISTEDCDYSFIEATDNDENPSMFLVRF